MRIHVSKQYFFFHVTNNSIIKILVKVHYNILFKYTYYMLLHQNNACT